MALAPVRAFTAETVVGGGTDLRPDRAIFGNTGKLGEIAALGFTGPLQHTLELQRGLAAGEGFGFGLFHPEQTEIVGTAFQQRGMYRRRQRLFDARQIAVIELILQGFGAGGDDHAFSGQQRRHQIGIGFTGAGAGLGDQDRAVLDGTGDFLG